MLEKSAQHYWPLLNGIICVYKPRDVSILYIRRKVKDYLCRELNNLKTRPPENYVEVNRTSSAISIQVRPSYADNVLCVGPRYQPEDVTVKFTSPLADFMSGVQIVGINRGWHLIQAIDKCNFTKCFHIKGLLGQATREFHINSQVVARARYKHVHKYSLEKILASYQSANQKRMFEMYNVDIQSQEAYEFALKGIHRPEEKAEPVIYSLQLHTFEPPHFTIEVQCINETATHLFNLIHNLGVSLKCFATCTGIRCIRHGCFLVDDTLLRKHLKSIPCVLNNMKHCLKKIEENFPVTLEHRPTVEVRKKEVNKQ